MPAKSISNWVDDISLRLIGGQHLLLRTPPRLGKTRLLHRVVEAIGSSAIYVDGKKFNEENQRECQANLFGKLEESLKQSGESQIVFDSADSALRLSQGPGLEGRLYREIINGPFSSSIGVIISARCSTSIQRLRSGSPLAGRLQPVTPPHGHHLPDQSREWVGNSSLLALAISEVGEEFLADRLEQDTSYISDVRAAAVDSLQGIAPDPTLLGYVERTALEGLLYEGGWTKLYHRLSKKLLAEDHGAPFWPSTLQESASKFATLIDGHSTAIWNDRYMYRDIIPLKNFLSLVRSQTDCNLRLMGGRSVSQRDVSTHEIDILRQVPGVECRFINATDYPDLHERHLSLGSSGWVLPQVHVIVQRQRAGNAIIAPAAAFPFNYSDIWRRSVVPL